MAGNASSAGTGETNWHRKRILMPILSIALRVQRLSDGCEARCPTQALGPSMTMCRFQQHAGQLGIGRLSTLIFQGKSYLVESFRHSLVAQPCGTNCVFFAQHLPEIGQTGL
jgi:hypothetical protein